MAAGGFWRRVAGAVPPLTRRGREFRRALAQIAGARNPARVEAILARAAGELAGAARVELVVDGDPRPDGGGDPEPRALAVWPDSARGMTPAQVEALGYPLALGIWRGGDRPPLALHIYARPGQVRGGRWPGGVVRRASALCAAASAALRAAHPAPGTRRDRPHHPGAPPPVVHDATYLCAILPYALAQARRHREELTVLCLTIDRLGLLARVHGADAVDRAVRRLADAVAAVLRGSDVVVRLDDDRIMVVLPDTGPDDLDAVGPVVRAAAAAACLPAGPLPALTASLGAACFPRDAPDMPGLLSAADDAMTREADGG